MALVAHASAAENAMVRPVSLIEAKPSYPACRDKCLEVRYIMRGRLNQPCEILSYEFHTVILNERAYNPFGVFKITFNH
jgi:hypothetical protein